MAHERQRLMPGNRGGSRGPGTVVHRFTSWHACLVFATLWACLMMTAAIAAVMSDLSGNLVAAYLNGCFLLTAVTASVFIRALPTQPGNNSFMAGTVAYFVSIGAMLAFGATRDASMHHGMWAYPTWENANFLVLFYFCMPPLMLGASLLSHAVRESQSSIR